MIRTFPDAVEEDAVDGARVPRLGEPDGLTDMLLYRVNRLRAVGGGIVLRVCEGQFGVTRREWVLLALLHRSGPVTPSALAERAVLERSATSKAIVALVGKGLVRRIPRPGDRRSVEVALTEAGIELVDRMMPVVRDLNARILATLDATEVALLDGILDRLQRRIDHIADDMAPWPLADRRQGGTRRFRPRAAT